MIKIKILSAEKYSLDKYIAQVKIGKKEYFLNCSPSVCEDLFLYPEHFLNDVIYAIFNEAKMIHKLENEQYLREYPYCDLTASSKEDMS